MALQLAAVANSIAALSVSGVTLKDVDEIPTKVDQRAPTILPLPDYVTDFDVERVSFGSSTALRDVSYTLNYRFCYKPVGMGRQKTIEYYDEMIDKVALFFDAVMAIETLTGAVDITPFGVTNMGIVNDPSDNEYIGCDLAVRILEFAG